MINPEHIGPAFTAIDSGAIIRVHIVSWTVRYGVRYAITETGDQYPQTSLVSADDHLATFPTSTETATPLEWSALWTAMQANYDAKSDAWTLTTQHMFDEMLGVVPPVAMRHGAFLVGEASDHNEHGQAVYAAFRQLPGNVFHAKYMTANEFRTV